MRKGRHYSSYSVQYQALNKQLQDCMYEADLVAALHQNETHVKQLYQQHLVRLVLCDTNHALHLLVWCVIVVSNVVIFLQCSALWYIASPEPFKTLLLSRDM